jgi:hypothetical protein
MISITILYSIINHNLFTRYLKQMTVRAPPFIKLPLNDTINTACLFSTESIRTQSLLAKNRDAKSLVPLISRFMPPTPSGSSQQGIHIAILPDGTICMRLGVREGAALLVVARSRSDGETRSSEPFA